MDTRTKQSFAWLPEQMPMLQKLINDHRAKHGPEWLTECWKRGVVAQEPGWFFASEGALSVGTPWAGDPTIAALILAKLSPSQVVVVLRPKEGGDV
jgi:hypothetical protein